MKATLKNYIPFASPSIVMKAFTDALRDSAGNALWTVYTNDLESAGDALSSQQSKEQDITLSTTELFAWTRTALIRDENTMRGRAGCITRPSDAIGQPEVVSSSGQFLVQWRYYATDMHTIENFEILYNANAGIAGVRGVSITLNDTVFEYTFNWQPIETLEVLASPAYTKYIEGSMLVTGTFVGGTRTTTTEVQAQIQTINTAIPPAQVSDVVTSILFYQ